MTPGPGRGSPESLLAGPCAVLTMELQRGVLDSFPALACAVTQPVGARSVLGAVADLLGAARARGTPVVHCTFGSRPGREPANAPLLAMAAGTMLDGTPAVDLAVEAAPGDLVSHRGHGVAPFAGTDLDPTLRSLGVTTVVATGVSTNLGILGLAIEAVDLGYHVVVPADAVAGVPADYAAAVLRHSLSLVATLTDVDTVRRAWGDPHR